MSPSIAVIIPTFNRAELLGRAIDSVLAQSRRPDEVIVVDDGSSDRTDEVVERYAGNLTVLRKSNGGVSSARNAGVRAATTDFVAFLDSDDFWYEDHLARIESAIVATNGGAGLYFSDQRLAPSRGTTAWQRAEFSIDDAHGFEKNGRDWAFMDRQPMTTNAAVVRRDAYLRVGGCDERLVCREDTHLFLKLGLSVPNCAVPGLSGMLTAGDETSLSIRYSAYNVTYLRCTVILYGDVMRKFRADLAPEEKRLLARRMATAHWSLARRTTRSPHRAILHALRAVVHDPASAPRTLSRRMRAMHGSGALGAP